MKYAATILGLLVVTVQAHGQGEQSSDPELHYSIKLPKGWRRLPTAVADRVTGALSLQAGVTAPKFQAWFQRSDKPEGDYPYLLVSNQSCKMPTLGELEAGLKTRTQTATERTLILKGVVSNVDTLDPVIDTRRAMVFYGIDQTVKINNTGKIKGIMCIFPGKNGVAQLNFNTRAEEAERSKADFESFLDSFIFEPGYDYQSGLGTYTSTPGFDYSRFLMFGLIGGILLPLCCRVLKSRNPNSTPSILRVRVLSAMLIALGGLEFLIDPSGGPIRFTFLFGSVALGVIGFVVAGIIERKLTARPLKEAPTGQPPPVQSCDP